LGNQLRMFDKIRLRLDDAWDQHLSLGELHTFEQRPFVSVARVGGFQR
jgi:hypothetical protein